MPVRLPSRAEERLSPLIEAIRALAEGRSNAIGSLTLAVSPATSTVVAASTCSPDSAVFISPKTASAAAALTGCYITAGNGQFTVTHAASAAADRTFWFVALG